MKNHNPATNRCAFFRAHRILELLSLETYPNATVLAKDLEVCVRSVTRDIASLRLSYNIFWDERFKGYALTEKLSHKDLAEMKRLSERLARRRDKQECATATILLRNGAAKAFLNAELFAYEDLKIRSSSEVEVSFRLEDEDALAWYLITCGKNAVVLSPDSFRATVRTHAEILYRHHEQALAC